MTTDIFNMMKDIQGGARSGGADSSFKNKADYSQSIDSKAFYKAFEAASSDYNKPAERPEKFEKSDKPAPKEDAYAAKPAERPERLDRPEKADKAENAERPERLDRPEKADKAENAEPAKSTSIDPKDASQQAKDTQAAQAQEGVSKDTDTSTEDRFTDILDATRKVLNGEDGTTVSELKLFSSVFLETEMSEEELKKLAQAVEKYRNGEISVSELKNTLPEGMTMGQLKKAMAFLQRVASAGQVDQAGQNENTQSLADVIQTQITANKAEGTEVSERQAMFQHLTKGADSDGAETQQIATLNAVADTNKAASATKPTAIEALMALQGNQAKKTVSEHVSMDSEGTRAVQKNGETGEGLKRLDKVMGDNGLKGNVNVGDTSDAAKLANAAGQKMNGATMMAAQSSNAAALDFQTMLNNGGPQNLQPLHSARPAEISIPTANGFTKNIPATEQVAVQINKAVKAGTDQIKVNLNPAELGSVDVELTLTRDAVKAVVKADSPETLALLQRDASQLTRALNEAGLKTNGNALEFSLNQDNADRQQQTPQQASAATFNTQSSDEVGIDSATQKQDYTTMTTKDMSSALSSYNGTDALDIRI